MSLDLLWESMRRIWLLILVLVTGCCGFNREWDRAVVEPPGTNAVAGRWDGFWMSERNGHNGRLRCLIQPATKGTFSARFHARYWKVLSFGYTVPLAVRCSNEVCRFESEANLGKLAGGVYRYAGTVAGTNFHSSYRSKYDHGYFQMRRVD